jgi:hypothetical protein
MIKKLAMLAAAGLLYIAVPTAPASAQGISVHVGGGHHHGYHGPRGYHRGHGYRGSRAYYAPRHHHRHGYHGGVRKKVIVVR